MDYPPNITTARLILRPFTLENAPTVAALAGDRRVAETTQNIPHPYSRDDALAWIGSQLERFKEGGEVVFAIEHQPDKALLGAIGLVLKPEHSAGELGYWIGVPFWGNGYCTEAAQAVLDYGFHSLALHRIMARHFTKNPASGRVMQKIGMRYEGCLRQSVLKWGEYQDVSVYAILHADRED
ncbi:MAG: GNAT family N-acetyltransferase [Anaerolineales bacterium]|nr:GNAT family N-acetyltransferase [Anaerolineales bacterium]